MSDAFNDAAYRYVPRFDAAGGIGLATALAAAAPGNRPPRLDRALTAMNSEASKVNAAFGGKLATASPTSNVKALDTRIDHHWTAIFHRVNAWTLHDPEEPEVDRAHALAATLFPDGLSFLKLGFDREWAESKRRLELVHGPVENEVVALAGQPFLNRLREAHDAYGKGLGITAAAPSQAAHADSLTPALRKLSDAIGAYVLQLLANFDPADANELATLRSALAPIDQFKAKAASRARASAQPQPPLTPPAQPKA